MKHRTPLLSLGITALLLISAAGFATAQPRDKTGKTDNTALAAPAAMPAPTPAAAKTAPAPKPVAPAAMGSVTAAKSAPPPQNLDPTRSHSPSGATTNPTPSAGDEDPDREAKRYQGGDHTLTSIVVPVVLFLCIVLIVGAVQWSSFRKDRNRHQTLQLMVEKGAQIPVELITPQKRKSSDLRKGLVLIGAGIGTLLFLLLTHDARNSGAWGLGLIPTLIGCGYLLAWRLERGKDGNGDGNGDGNSDSDSDNPHRENGRSQP